MEGFEMLTKLKSVEAPPGFERMVMLELTKRKARRVRVRHVRLMLAGAGVPVAALALILVTGVLKPEYNPSRASIRADESTPLYMPGTRLSGGPVIPITEGVSYSQDVRKHHRDSRTIYILEQVSNSSDTEIMF